MIVMRIDCAPSGLCKIRNYNDPSDGWFPVDSISFGFSGTEMELSKSSSGSSQGGGNNAATNKEPEADRQATTLTFSKQIDGVSCDLMLFAMLDRMKTKKPENEEIWCGDIHFLQSGRAESAHVWPYLMIHLNNILVKNWSISASGDERPTENVELWYEKHAMQYFPTADGKERDIKCCRGWDQSKNEQWLPPSPFDAYFPSSLAQYIK